VLRRELIDGFLVPNLASPSMYKATISITLRPSILDPEGKTVQHALTNLGYEQVSQVRMGKQAEVWIEAEEEEEARRVATEACEKLLANPVTEDFEIHLEPVSSDDIQEMPAE
jgi:phosphoribosylformylglycinamidine synthase